MIVNPLCTYKVQKGNLLKLYLFILDGFGNNLCVEMVVEAVVEVGLDGQRLVQELLEEVLLRVLTHKHALGVGVLSRSK